MTILKTFSLTLLFCYLFAGATLGQRQMEYLNRGIVAVKNPNNTVYVGWRLLGTEPEETAFNLYRKSGNKKPVRLNKQPITSSTNFVDTKADLKKETSYFVKPVLQGKELAASETAVVWEQNYLSIPLQTPEGYTANDASVGDLNGDGEYEVIIHMTGRSRDTPSKGFTDEPIFQAYKLDGTLLWEINLGKNIREGAHYTQFIVIDMDGDGKAEFACKTADGTTDGKGKVIGDASKDWRDADGKILQGPEFFTVFSGETGEALATADYLVGRGDLCGWGGVGGNGGNDCSGNRSDRFLAGAAYLDGKLPSVLMCRGYYGRSVIAAWDWRDGKLTSRWVFDSENSKNPFSGQGNHSLSVNDIDGDGKDEIVYGAMAVDDDGKGIYSTGLRHGDALHVSRFDPTNPDQLVWGVHEIETEEGLAAEGYGVALFNARTGEIIWGGEEKRDVGRGMIADLDPRNPGAEMWWNGSDGLYNVKGKRISKAPTSVNFGIWWDGDLLREILDRNFIDKWDYEKEEAVRLFSAEGCSSNNGTKATPALSADILGDWREEVMFRTEDSKELRIFTTTIPTEHRLYTLMHDPQYRLSIAWQNVGYNQPPHTSYFLGHGMAKPPKPNIIVKTPAAQ
ncbi:rhamnogalacturonan lyase [Pontibacter qinzhouensis]|uniref:rhamnogalacturonan lyase n=1 Tax=Pontibacter qinzhouensis TaxID=2603253 RepID=UPI0016501AD6|nr:rhamnogalacturonan lyase [Pontibacter qinzhouensis]